jgi:hypothetical protein
MTSPERDEHTESSRLAELLACEQELEDLRARARDEAAEVVARARRDVDERRAEMAAGLIAEVETLRERVREELRREVERARAQAEAQAARYDAVDDAEVERLAEVAFHELVGRAKP